MARRSTAIDGPPQPPGYNAARLRERLAPATSTGGRSALPFVAGAVLVLVVILGAVMLVYDHGRRDMIAPGVRVGGIDVGGLSLSAARQRLRQRLVTPLEKPLVVSAAGRHFVLSASSAHMSVNVDAAARQAVADSRRGWIVGRVLDAVDGRSINLNITPQVSYSQTAVNHLVSRVAAAGHRPARDATVSPSASGLHPVASQNGIAVKSGYLRARVEQVLNHPSGDRNIVAPTVVIHPKVTIANLAAHYPAYILIDRAAFQLRLYQHLHLSNTYTIAVGRQGLETPAGLYAIQEKEVNPSWHVPNSSWAGSLAGQTIPPGPADPIKARWLGFNGGAGIHGTDESSSLGTAASHGCIRMAIPDVIALYPHVSVGTPVYVV